MVERPTHSAAFIFALAAVTILLLNARFPSLLATPHEQYSKITSDIELSPLRDPESRLQLSLRSRERSLWSPKAVFTTLLVVIRIELLRRILGNVQCSALGVEACLKLFKAWLGLIRAGLSTVALRNTSYLGS